MNCSLLQSQIALNANVINDLHNQEADMERSLYNHRKCKWANWLDWPSNRTPAKITPEVCKASLGKVKRKIKLYTKLQKELKYELRKSLSYEALCEASEFLEDF